MLKKTITYQDLDGNRVVEDFYFNLSKAEIAEMELSYKGGFSEHIKTMIAENDGGKIIAQFKEILTKTVGRRSEDGRRFIKSEEITNEFLQTDAYSELFMELLQDGGGSAVALFIKGIMPFDMQDQVAEAVSNASVETLSLPQEEPVWVREDRDPTKEELQSMTQEQLREAFLRKGANTLD